jgi:hypothetical protein
VKIVALSDIHGHVGPLERVADELRHADLVLLSGDLTDFGRCDDIAAVVEAVRFYNPMILAVTGNCDQPECESYLTTAGVALHAQSRMVDGFLLAGLGGSLPCLMPTPNEQSEDDLRDVLEALAGEMDPTLPCIFVTHQPPYDTIVDLARTGEHVGSRAVRAFIERVQPLVCFTGHIHEGRGIDRIGGTEIVNPGSFAVGGYAVAEIDIEVLNISLCSVE